MNKRKAAARGLFVVLLLSSLTAVRAETNSSKDEKAQLAQMLYDGVRASQLLGSNVVSKTGQHLGKIRNIVLADDGTVRGFIAEQTGDGVRPEFMFRLPWKQVVLPIRPGNLVADLDPSHMFGLFPLAKDDHDNRKPDLPVTEIIGDYARLQTGRGYGYVNDVVLTPEGRMLAVLVTRDTAEGGGTFAFSYPGRTGRWSPDWSYYGLAFITSDQANGAGLKVDSRKFKLSGSG
jgi:sporulation protein YlmC with PRC-barrel domain